MSTVASVVRLPSPTGSPARNAAGPPSSSTQAGSPPSRYSPTSLLSKVRNSTRSTSPTPIKRTPPSSPSSLTTTALNGVAASPTVVPDDVNCSSPSPPPHDDHLSSDLAGSEASDQDDLDYSSDLRRVKVYELVDLQWEDRGTAFCTGDFDENAQEAKIIAKAESNPDQILLQHTIRGADVYQRQQDTLILWTETDGTDYALSFQDIEGCAEVWEFIGEVQRHLNGKGENAISPTIGPEPQTTSQIIQSGRLPQLTLGLLKEVDMAIKALSRSSTAKGRLCEYIIHKNYVKSMVDILHQAEDLESLDDLHSLCSCMQSILLLNDHMIYEYILADELFEGVCGMLEYDPEFPSHKAAYREFLQGTSKFKPVVEFRDDNVQRKVLQTYRLQFLKDVVLSRAIDDATFNVLNSCIIFNQIDIIGHVQQEEAFLRQVVSMFVDGRWWSTIGVHGRITPPRQPGKRSRSPTPPSSDSVAASVTEENRRDAIFLLQQLCAMAKNVQLPARMALFRTVVEHGALHALQWALAYGSTTEDQLLISTAGELLTLLVEHDTSGARSHILRQATALREDEKERSKEPSSSKSPSDSSASVGPRTTEVLLAEMIRSLNSSQEWALKSQMADTLRVLLDSPTESQGVQLTAIRALRPKDDPNHDSFLEQFYNGWVSDLFAPLMSGVPEFKSFTDPLFRLDRDTANLYLYLCDLLSSFPNFMFQSKIHTRIATLLRAKDKHVRLAALRVFRSCMKADNPKVNQLLDEQEVFAPILEFTLRESRRDNLLSSAAQEMFDFIRKENRKDVIRGIMNRHQLILQRLVTFPTTSDRFKMLIRRHEMNIEPPPIQDSASKALGGHRRSSVDTARLAEIEEEAYFNGDDGSSGSGPKSPTSTVKRRRMRPGILMAGSRPGARAGSAPLVDYVEEEEEEEEYGPQPAPEGDTISLAGPSSPKASSAGDADEMDTESGPPAFGLRPTVKRRRPEDEEDDDDGLARLASRKRPALSLRDEDDSRPATSLKRGESTLVKKIQLVLGSSKTLTVSPAGPPSDEQMKDDGG
ncbi:DUF625-domain-containing protein [Auriculariales sp. MPI-PUGE-AT-0066]|nr:DUF625-domain-containing protein [Auriculariales sp. MPI-PUGE-AT-0066]